MPTNENTYEVTIIGCGPRGLSALESLFIEASRTDLLPKVVLIEKTDYPGAGPVYTPDQPDGNWLNVSERDIAIEGRIKTVFKNFTIPEFPTYQEWSGYRSESHSELEVDKFPLRSEVGHYLTERFRSIADVIRDQGLLSILRSEAQSLNPFGNAIAIGLRGGQIIHSIEVALCIGHQPIELDEQLSNWLQQLKRTKKCQLYTQPYPIANILDSNHTFKGKTCAVRGFGLAMIDVVRALTTGVGGKFVMIDQGTRAMEYVPSGREPKCILPFSLDGLPLASKPLNQKIDQLYIPSDKQLKAYKNSLEDSLGDDAIASSGFLIKAIIPLIIEVFQSMKDYAISYEQSEKELGVIIQSWLEDEKFCDPLITNTTLPVEEIMKRFVLMGCGKLQASLDYCIGHVWRHCQPTMYKILSFADIPDSVIAEIIALDERLKRYSYGPPLDSLSQLLALVNSKILNLSMVEDPDIALSESGWKFTREDDLQHAEIMINSVLEAPKITGVKTALISELLHHSFLKPIHNDLGALTKKNAVLVNESDQGQATIALMGRLAKGTLIGVDAIAECFGNRSHYWAEGVLERLQLKEA